MKVGSKVKFDVDFLEACGFDELNETEILFIQKNKDTVYTIVKDWNENKVLNYDVVYPFELSCPMFKTTSFSENELILVEV